MKKLFLLVLAIGGILLNGCEKGNDNGNQNGENAADSSFELAGRSHTVTGAVVFRYAPDASGTTNYEVSLLLDGTTCEDLTEGFGYEVYFDLYFDGAVDELVPGEYVFSDAGVFRDGVYSGHSSTEDVGYDVVAGTLTVGKDGNG